jgi:ribosomal protein S27AE
MSVNVSFCPKCKKAGLRYVRIKVHSFLVKEPQYHYEYPDTPKARAALQENADHLGKGERWCPRCGEWVKPTRHDVMRPEV